jgi:hypothetical protein
MIAHTSGYTLGAVFGVILALTASGQQPCRTQPVPPLAPDSVPASIYERLFADSNRISLLPRRSDRQPRNVILVVFRASATARQRRAALDAVCGRMVGGWRIGDTEGYYVVEAKTDGTASALWRAIDRLAAQPGVESAEPNIPEVSPLGRR